MRDKLRLLDKPKLKNKSRSLCVNSKKLKRLRRRKREMPNVNARKKKSSA